NLVHVDIHWVLIEAAQRAARVAIEFLLCNAHLLEIENVVKATSRLRSHRVGRLKWSARDERGVYPDDALDPIGIHQRRVPRGHPAPVVSDDHALLESERVEHPNYIDDDLLLRVCLDGPGASGG